MSDSSICAELFGDEEEEVEIVPAPEYIQQPEFKKFVEEERITVDETYGFLQLKTFKEFYFPGQVVRGYAVLTAFNTIPSKDIHIRVKGFEVPAEHTPEVIKNIRQKKNLMNSNFKAMGQSLNRSLNLSKVYDNAGGYESQTQKVGTSSAVDQLKSGQQKQQERKGSKGSPQTARSQLQPQQSQLKLMALKDNDGRKTQEVGGNENTSILALGSQFNQSLNGSKSEQGFWKDENLFTIQNLAEIDEQQNQSQIGSQIGNHSIHNEIVFLSGGCRAFSFRKSIQKGQYVLPFSFKLPNSLPGSFNMMQVSDDKSLQQTRICYQVEIFVDKYRKTLSKVHEFNIREYLFTASEIDFDVSQQQMLNQVKQLFKIKNVLKPIVKTSNKKKSAQIESVENTNKNREKFFQNLKIYFMQQAAHIKNTQWDFNHQINSRSLCCGCFGIGGGGTVSVNMKASLSKPLYFQDETVKLVLEVDNSASERSILAIEVTLRQKLRYKKTLSGESKAQTVEKYFDLKMIEFGELQHGENSGFITAEFDLQQIQKDQDALTEKVNALKSNTMKLKEIAESTVVTKKPSQITDSKLQFAERYLSQNMSRQAIKDCMTCTHCAMLSVHGYSIDCNFSVTVVVKVAGTAGMFASPVVDHVKEFPIFIRTRPLPATNIADVEQLGLLPQALSQQIKNLQTKFSYVEKPIILPGCTQAYDQLTQTREFIREFCE